jgi:hypothetical protein
MEHYNYVKTRTDIVRKLSPIKKTLLISDNKIQTKFEFTVTYNSRYGGRYMRQKFVQTFNGNLLKDS